jgi:hypothetical protein
MGRRVYHVRFDSRKEARSGLIERAHKFLTTRDRGAFEAAAERFFTALGYRRRGDEESGALVFERGSYLIVALLNSLRRLETRLELSMEGSGTPAAPVVAVVRHRVRTPPLWIVLERNRRYLDAEAKGFERFLEHGDLELAEVIGAAQGRSTGDLWVRIIVTAVAAAVAIVLVFEAFAMLFSHESIFSKP